MEVFMEFKANEGKNIEILVDDTTYLRHAIKMQYAIDVVGLRKVLYASVASAATKLLGTKGKFYEMVGQEVSGLDGFYGKVWKE